ncbi:hypothetical protein F5884DRAFT_903864 [Xylogone sp. PMI_703]|nr:hypothetical protein F5884DRAFT_903864 [Xylogone sp. PMI_703]
MDGISAGASIIALIQISAQLFNLCQNYYVGVKGARDDIRRLRNELITLQDILTEIQDLTREPVNKSPSTLDVLNGSDGPISQCMKDLEQLLTKLNAYYDKDKITKLGYRALKWPFSSKDVDKLLQIIQRHKITFNLALTADQYNLTRIVRDNVASLINDNHWQSICDWLEAPDPSSSHNSAYQKHQPATGEWLINSSQYEKWKTLAPSFLWLHGIPGCGKTVICSTIVEDIIASHSSDPKVTIGYFYFDFNDVAKQRYENLIRSLIIQFSSQSMEVSESLSSLFSSCQDGQRQSKTDELLRVLENVLRGHREMFIIIDALDECQDRERLLALIETIVDWKIQNLRILVTSRKERDIEEYLEHLATEQIPLQSATVNNDIRIHISERLKNDPKLNIWPASVQTEIEKTLMGRADGMFRWVECQLDTLRKCLKLDKLRRALNSLPKTLDETYARILCNIDDEYIEDAFKVLEVLVYSARPLLIKEAAEVVAIDVDENGGFNPENRLRSYGDVLRICSSLVSISDIHPDKQDGQVHRRQELRLAHFSVKEYLISNQIRIRQATKPFIQGRAEARIAQMCLAYLLYFEGPKMIQTSDDLDRFPLAKYAAQYWIHHYRAAGKNTETIDQLSRQLFISQDAYINWIRLFDIEEPWRYVTVSLLRNAENTPPQLYYASIANLVEPAKMLLENGANVNAKGGYYGNALQAAAYKGAVEMVMLLIKNGAHVSARGGRYATALLAATTQGHQNIVKILLEHGADVNMMDYSGIFRSETALYAAASRGHEDIVQLLLEYGADADIRCGFYGCALQVAAAKGYATTAGLLLNGGADVNKFCGHFGTSLQAAVIHRHVEITKLLLEHQAGPNLNVDNSSSPLQHEVYHGDVVLAKLLLKHGVNNFLDSMKGARVIGLDAIEQLLLEKLAEYK